MVFACYFGIATPLSLLSQTSRHIRQGFRHCLVSGVMSSWGNDMSVDSMVVAINDSHGSYEQPSEDSMGMLQMEMSLFRPLLASFCRIHCTSRLELPYVETKSQYSYRASRVPLRSLLQLGGSEDAARTSGAPRFLGETPWQSGILDKNLIKLRKTQHINEIPNSTYISLYYFT